MSDTFKTDANYELAVANGWDRDGELMITLDVGHEVFRLYFSQADVIRLRNVLSIRLGE